MFFSGENLLTFTTLIGMMQWYILCSLMKIIMMKTQGMNLILILAGKTL